MLVETFHMIDTCDPAIAGWAEDGLTFIVKDPEKFETNIIPQFFKHSKFTSFVRVSMEGLSGRVNCCPLTLGSFVGSSGIATQLLRLSQSQVFRHAAY
jgi:HSF-type DNA-binding